MSTRYPWKFTVLRILPTGWEVIGHVEHARKLDARKLAEAMQTPNGLSVIVNSYAFERAIGAA